MLKVTKINKRDKEGSSEEGTNQTREYNRVPWTGGLDEEEMVRPGGLLLAALLGCANQRRQQLNEMARELGITYGYINQLRSGIRLVSQVSDDFALACARYLEVPRLTVLMLAGRITAKDFLESDEMMASEISRAMTFLSGDATWGPLVTPELRQSSLESQYCLVRLFEVATGKVLMDNNLTAENLMKEISNLQAIQSTRVEQLKRKHQDI